jgi:hypothetical protein
VAAVWAPVEEAETAPVTVVEEAEPWSGARRHGAEEAHSLQAPLVEEPEKVAAAEAPNGAGTPARARRSVQVVAGPWVEAPEPRVARLKAPSPRQVRRMAPPSEEPEPVVYQKNLLEKEKQKQSAAPPGQKTWTQCQDPGWVWRRKRGSPTCQTQHVGR